MSRPAWFTAQKPWSDYAVDEDLVPAAAICRGAGGDHVHDRDVLLARVGKPRVDIAPADRNVELVGVEVHGGTEC
jgi:hypothetical protein